MSDITNFGTLLKVSGSAIAGLVKIDPPKSVRAAIKANNHSSNYGKKIDSGLIELDDIKATFSMNATVMTTLWGYHSSGSVVEYQIAFPNGKTMTFPALLTEFQPGSADADNPELLKVEVTFTPTSGSIAFG